VFGIKIASTIIIFFVFLGVIWGFWNEEMPGCLTVDRIAWNDSIPLGGWTSAGTLFFADAGCGRGRGGRVGLE
jgi:hypothetical protein